MSPTSTTSREGAAPSRPRQPEEPPRVPVEMNDARPLAESVPEPPALDWSAIAAAFRAGDRTAAEVVATRLAPFVTQLVRRLTAWRGEVDDLTQDVLVAALADRSKFRGDAQLETWITRIAINRVRAHGRKQWLRRQLFAAWAGQQPPSTAPPVDVAAVDSEQAQAVRDAVAHLPTKSREAIVLCYLQHQTPAEAAAALGVSVNAVEVRLTRAREKLRELLNR